MRNFYFALCLIAASAFAALSLVPSGAAACDAAPASEDAHTGSDGAPRFIWPVHGMPINDLCSNGSERRSGVIEIAVREGTEVKAAAAGIVAYAGDALKDFGNIVIVQHDGGWVTAYGYASRLLVSRGDQVRQGQAIALTGRKAVTDTPQLHFEIRNGNHPVDAFRLLSQRRSAAPRI